MPSLTQPQADFLDLPHKFRAFIGGYGSGKSWAGASAHCRSAWETPRVNTGYFAPTYPMIRDIFYPTITEVAEDWGLRADIKVANKEVHLYEGAQYRSTIICRSMDSPSSIVGFKIGYAQADEIDLLPADKATAAWRKIIARLRHPMGRNGADVTTTPEGFRFAYQTFVKDVRDKPERAALYAIVHASTYENETHLPAGYIDSLRASYPPNLIEAYLQGRFVNLASGAVYASFDRRHNHCDSVIEAAEPLHIGMDFNVLNMTAIVFVTRNAHPHAVAELTGVRDTPTMARLLNERYKGHHLTIYPDATGQSTSSKNASESDLSILKQAGLSVRVNPTNPAVKDRVNAVNAMILNDKGERRSRINTHLCPVLTEALEQQAYDKNGEPDKTTGHDHACFAGDTLVQTREGLVRFDELAPTGEVLAPHGGFVAYRNAGLTGCKRTVRVSFANGYGVDCTEDHRFLTKGGAWVMAKDLSGCVCASLVMTRRNSWAPCTTDAGGTFRTQVPAVSAGFIGQFGSLITGRLRTAFTSIISMANAAITKSRTWCACRPQIMPMLTGAMYAGQNWSPSLTNIVISRKHGTALTKGDSGIDNTTSACVKACTRVMLALARTAGHRLKLSRVSRTLRCGFVPEPAKPPRDGVAALTISNASARDAVSRSGPTSTLAVLSVSAAGPAEAVYCLSVPAQGCFKLTATSPIVSNCDAAGYRIVHDWPIVRRQASVHALRV